MDHILRTDTSHDGFKSLVVFLDAELAERDRDENDFYIQFNGITILKHCVVYLENTIPLGCGALKPFDTNSMEIKRMYVNKNSRGKGIASLLLLALEQWTKELGFTHCVLETGLRQPEAIALYKKNNYKIIPNYPPYQKMTNSICFSKKV